VKDGDEDSVASAVWHADMIRFAIAQCSLLNIHLMICMSIPKKH